MRWTVRGEPIDLVKCVPFALVHAAALAGAMLVGVSKVALIACAIGYLVRTWAITAGYHRYFSHRSYATSRAFQFVLAVLGATAAQKGPLWWAAYHRRHHRESDGPEDIHSPAARGFFWAHMGWILSRRYERTPLEEVPDLARFPELVWLDRNSMLPPVAVAVATWLVFGKAIFVWSCLVATVAGWHLLFSANSICHLFGTRRFATREGSRNNAVLGVLLLGEGWHNNHHAFPRSARQGFTWWEVDLSFYVLWVLQKLSLIRDLRGRPAGATRYPREQKLRAA